MSVNSHTEWQPLEEVILGNLNAYDPQVDDLSFRVFFHDNIFSKYWKKGAQNCDRRTIDYRRHIDEMTEDLDDGLIYRFIPDVKGDLKSGRLQALGGRRRRGGHRAQARRLHRR